MRTRDFSTATLLVYPMLLRVQPRNLPVKLARAPAVEYSWPSVVVQRLVWSYRRGLPAIATVLLAGGRRRDRFEFGTTRSCADACLPASWLHGAGGRRKRFAR